MTVTRKTKLTPILNSMRNIKPFIALALMSSLAVGLTGCSLFGANETTPEPSETAAVQEVLVNPTANGSSVPVSTNTFSNGVELQVFYAGTGYPTESELQVAESGVPVSTEVKLDDKGNVIMPEADTDLVKDRRVIALGYTLTNNGSSPIKLNTFNWSTVTSASGELKTVSTDYALHSMLGYPNVPADLTVNPEAELNPGSSATWGADVIVSDNLIDQEKVDLTQTFNIGADQLTESYSVKTKENKPAQGQEIRSEQEEK
jgi:hypothetical protein